MKSFRLPITFKNQIQAWFLNEKYRLLDSNAKEIGDKFSLTHTNF